MTSKILYSLIFMSLGYIAIAQNDTTSSIENLVKIDVTDRVIELEKADRIYMPANVEVPQPEIQELTYTPRDFEVKLPDLSPRIRLYTIQPEKLPVLYGNYLKVGYGNYASPYFEGYLASKRNEKYSYGLHLKHHSSGKGNVEGDLSGYSNNHALAFGKIFGDEITWGGEIGYDRDRYHYFGVKNIESVDDRDSIRQIYNQVQGKVSLERKRNDRHVTGYESELGFYNFSNRFDGRETAINWALSVEHGAEENAYWKVDASADYWVYNDSAQINRNLFRLSPSYVIKNDRYKLDLGINLALENDTLDELGKFHFYPAFSGVYYLSEKLHAFAGLEGDLSENTFRNTARQNPWLAENIAMQHTNIPFSVYGGVKGSVLEKINYKAQLSFKSMENVQLLVNDTISEGTFLTLYDGGNTSLLQFDIQGEYELNQKVKVGLRSQFNNYSMGDEEEAWHLPGVNASLYGHFNIYNKLFITATTNYISGITARNPEDLSARDLDPIIDISLEADYNLLKRWFVFAEIRNILSNNYEKYLNYPTQGVNFIGGLSFSF